MFASALTSDNVNIKEDVKVLVLVDEYIGA